MFFIRNSNNGKLNETDIEFESNKNLKLKYINNGIVFEPKIRHLSKVSYICWI